MPYPTRDRTRIIIYDLLGMEAARLIDEFMAVRATAFCGTGKALTRTLLSLPVSQPDWRDLIYQVEACPTDARRGGRYRLIIHLLKTP